MTPPETDLSGDTAAGDQSPAVSLRPKPSVLRKRRDFTRAARGKRVAMPGFIVQMVVRPEGEATGIRVGFTCSKKVGNAVARNRAKRRLREIARLTLPRQGKPGNDYVLIGRRNTTATLPFDQLKSDFARALDILHGVVK
ncbi:ribonuclease P protein component [Sulfitobacter sp. S190]|uniref:ribonuclease P protein component n=1 Tax=Sulfitobacter sp. S190 TaxID=2867022 RepID=UPI0021A4BF86|nr:ribonuclease P protein component [Sulfitobacter sp. S190]UWR23011.1 ribonuclease P protein component [Sulfitobacter sp. S190]